MCSVFCFVGLKLISLAGDTVRLPAREGGEEGRRGEAETGVGQTSK